MKKISFILFLGLGLFGLFAINGCQKDANSNGYKGLQSPDLPATLYNYSDIDVPVHFNNGFEYGPTGDFDLTDARATLGRVLFYDTKLSLSNEVSCASCHHQSKAFSDKVALSEGIIDNQTPRNSQAIINPAMEQTFFWDSRVSDLEEMVLLPILNHNELGLENLDDLVTKLDKVDYYLPLFEDAYGSTVISKQRIATALADFLQSMFSADSKHDKAMIQMFETGGTGNIFSQKELQGKAVFEDSGCNNCHGGPDLRGSWGDDWANIGLELEYKDKGLGEEGAIFGGPGAEGFFKVPSLRNIELTGPYMHDGRFNTLMEVINHYSEGIVAHPNLDWRLVENFSGGNQTPEPKRLNLSDTEKENLITFLKTFTDHSLITDERFSDPFGR